MECIGDFQIKKHSTTATTGGTPLRVTLTPVAYSAGLTATHWQLFAWSGRLRQAASLRVYLGNLFLGSP
jgi:hypothetical protein